MRLSALDLCAIPSGASASVALDQAVALGRHADAIGLERLWLAEHHNAASLASSCPELLIARIGAHCQRIRLGAGGIMLPNHSPLKVAEMFRVLSAMYPGRIDLGLGRAPGTDPRTAALLRRGVEVVPDDIPPMLTRLLDLLGPDDVPRQPFTTDIVAIPAEIPAPELFLLSSSGYGAKLAAERGLGLAFAHHMNPRDARAAVRAYRSDFTPSPWRDAPYAIVSVGAVCGETTAEAEWLAKSGAAAMLSFSQGRRDLPLPTPAEAADALQRAGTDGQALQRLQGRAPIVGDVDRVATELRRIADACDADELMLLTMVHDQVARHASYQRVADAFSVAS